jgi:hypothetical protein
MSSWQTCCPSPSFSRMIQIFSFWIPLARRRSARGGLVAEMVAATTRNVRQVVNELKVKGKT